MSVSRPKRTLLSRPTKVLARRRAPIEGDAGASDPDLEVRSLAPRASERRIALAQKDSTLLEVMVTVLIVGIFATVLATIVWPNAYSGSLPNTPYESPKDVIDPPPNP